MQTLRSALLYFILNFQRVTDHLWRYYSGMPMMKRSKITPNLYLGGQFGPKGLASFKKLGITAVVNMRITPYTKHPDLEHIAVLHLPTPDQHAPTLNHLNQGVSFIKQQLDKGGNVYVHCRHGEGRGPTMVIAYLISQGMTYDDAHKLVQKVRTFIKVTPPQVTRLKEFEQLRLHAS